jgi:Sec-independent protein translocase protein TatA
MPIAQDMKSLGEDIVTSYDTRIAAVGNIIAETGDLLKRFNKEHKGMSVELKRDLAQGEDERLKAFKALLSDIQKRQKEREAEVGKMLKTFQKEHKEMADALEKMLAASENERLKEFKPMLAGIRKRIKEIGTEVANYLAEVKDDMTKAGEAWQKMAEQMAKACHGVAIKIEKGKPIGVTAGAEVKTVEEVAKPKKSASGRKGRRGRPKKS